MIDTKICAWLINNADEPIRYRVARELLKDEQAEKKIEHELLNNPVVQVWLKNLHPETPPPHHRFFDHGHGGFDFCLETAMLKAIQIGLHAGIPQVADIMKYYISQIELYPRSIYIPIFPAFIGIDNKIINNFMLDRLDKVYSFVRNGVYDIYCTEEEKDKLKGIPTKWKDKKFIKREFSYNSNWHYPLIYDIIGLYPFYHLNNPEITRKIDAVIQYISTDELHNTINDGYGILIAGDKRYHSMGWDPKYPGWFDAADYMDNVNATKLLFYAQNISKYPLALKTKWFNDLLNHLEKYKTEHGTYIFPKEWLKESQGYAVLGHHVSFGENRRKKNWLEIESTFYVQLLKQNI